MILIQYQYIKVKLTTQALECRYALTAKDQQMNAQNSNFASQNQNFKKDMGYMARIA